MASRRRWAKTGAFVGTYVFPYLQDAGGDDTVRRNQLPFFVAGGLCALSAGIASFCLPDVGQDTIANEDVRFREYLKSEGWDTTQLGLGSTDPGESYAGELSGRVGQES